MSEDNVDKSIIIILFDTVITSMVKSICLVTQLIHLWSVFWGDLSDWLETCFDYLSKPSIKNYIYLSCLK